MSLKYFLYFAYRLDTRTKGKIGEAVLIHKKGSKVVGLHCNPVQPDLLLSCGNDHFVSFCLTLLIAVFFHYLQYAHLRQFCHRF